jgi:hypothetical protein
MPAAASPASFSAGDLLARPVSFYLTKELKSPTAEMTIGEVIEGIRWRQWQMPVARVRETVGVDKATSKRLKGSLSVVTFAGVFGRHTADDLKRHSGLMVLDVDGLGDRMSEAKGVFAADPHVLACFISPGGAGLKAVVPVAAQTSAEHVQCFDAAAKHFRVVGFEVDCGRDVSRLCFVSDDPELIVREARDDVRVFFPLHPLTPELAPKPPDPCSIPPLILSAPHFIGKTCSYGGRIQANLRRSPTMRKIWTKFVDWRPVERGRRNQAIMKIVPTLYRMTSEAWVVRLSLLFYYKGRGVFKDSRVQHERETRAMLGGVARSYRAELSTDEGEVYDSLDVRERIAFRICRDLTVKSADSQFFMSERELGERLGCHPTQAGRILRRFCDLAILAVAKPGIKRAKGVRGWATTYRRKLSPARPESDVGVAQGEDCPPARHGQGTGQSIPSAQSA